MGARSSIGGQDVTGLAPYDRHIGMVFQDFLLFPHRTVAENVAFPAAHAGSQSDGARAAAGLGAGSGPVWWGWRSAIRTSCPVARGSGWRSPAGLVARPSLLLLDEPLANLDRELRREMEVEVRRYQQDLGIPFVYVTHNQEEALTLADRIAVMHEGRIEQIGATLEVYHAPATHFVASFVGAPNRLRARILEQNQYYARLLWRGRDLISLAVPDRPRRRSGRPVRQAGADRHRAGRRGRWMMRSGTRWMATCATSSSRGPIWTVRWRLAAVRS